MYDSYGKKCNSRFLLNYGFYNEENDANEVPIEVGISFDDPLLLSKFAFLKGTKKNRKFRVKESFNDEVTADLFAWLRLVEFDEDPIIFEKV